jgi:hypothetical protein
MRLQLPTSPRGIPASLIRRGAQERQVLRYLRSNMRKEVENKSQFVKIPELAYQQLMFLDAFSLGSVCAILMPNLWLQVAGSS